MKKKMIALARRRADDVSAGSAFAAFSGTDDLFLAAYNTRANIEGHRRSVPLSRAPPATVLSLTGSGVNSFNLATNIGSSNAANPGSRSSAGHDRRNLFASASSTNASASQASQYSDGTGKIGLIDTGYGGATALVPARQRYRQFPHLMNCVKVGTSGGFTLLTGMHS